MTTLVREETIGTASINDEDRVAERKADHSRTKQSCLARGGAELRIVRNWESVNQRDTNSLGSSNPDSTGN
jgi:hypothetical protein